jgi:hypothetical protein
MISQKAPKRGHSNHAMAKQKLRNATTAGERPPSAPDDLEKAQGWLSKNFDIQGVVVFL